MSLDSLNRQIDKILSELHKRQPREQEPFHSFTMHLFSEQEQASLSDFLLALTDAGSIDCLTNNQLDQYKYWLYLDIALKDEDLSSAEEYRQLLKECQEDSSERTPDMLLARFCAIDTRLFKTPISPGTGIHLTNFHRLQDKIAHGERLNGIEWNQVEWWCNYYEQYPARIASWNEHRAQYGKAS